MAEYDYSVREVVRDPDVLGKELLELGDGGWEVVTIMEHTSTRTTVRRTSWLIVSKKIIPER